MFHVTNIVSEDELECYRFIGTDEAHAAQPLARYLGYEVQEVKVERFPELHEVFP